jgi:hypothetical protein
MKLKLLVLATLLALPLTAGAVGVAVYPAEVTVTAPSDTQTTTRIKVSNPSSDVAVFEVYPDEFEPIIKINPSSFTLESSEERQVTVTISPREIGQLHTSLSVVGRPMASNVFQAGSGVKVPLAITVVQNTNGLASAMQTLGTSPWTGVVLGLLLIGLYGYRRKRTQLTTTTSPRQSP